MKVTVLSLRIALLIIICVSFQSVFSHELLMATDDDDEDVEIPLNGEWGNKGKSVIPPTLSFPINVPSAFIHNKQLFIKNLPTDYNILIEVSNSSGEKIIRQEVLKGSASDIFIPVNNLTDGVFKLELRKQLGGYLYGTFCVGY